MAHCALTKNMTMHRAHVPSESLGTAKVGSDLTLPTNVYHRLARVLRISADEEVELFDGSGLVVRGNLVSHKAELFFVASVERNIRKGPTLTLVQALVKQDKLEQIIQPITELGVHRVVLFLAHRCLVKVTERTPAQIDRLKRIATDAARQCERVDVPVIDGPITFAELRLLLGGSEKLLLLGDPRAEVNLVDVMIKCDEEKIHDVYLIIGPEGGLADEETSTLHHDGALLVRYAPHVLRTQTAGIVGMSIVQSFFR